MSLPPLPGPQGIPNTIYRWLGLLKTNFDAVSIKANTVDTLATKEEFDAFVRETSERLDDLTGPPDVVTELASGATITVYDANYDAVHVSATVVIDGASGGSTTSGRAIYDGTGEVEIGSTGTNSAVFDQTYIVSGTFRMEDIETNDGLMKSRKTTTGSAETSNPDTEWVIIKFKETE